MIAYNEKVHKSVLQSLSIGTSTIRAIQSTSITIVKAYWDVFVPEGIKKTILGYKFKVDTGTSKGVCCRPPNYGHYEGDIIMEHICAFQNNNWIQKCPTGSYGAPIVLAPKPHQDDVDNLKDFVRQV